jgi:hypothetical protein
MHTAPLPHLRSSRLPASPRLPLGLALLLGCAPPLAEKGAQEGGVEASDTAGPADTGPSGPAAPAGRLKFEEIYYSGAPGPAGEHLHTYSDQFYDLRNDSDVDVLLDGLCIGDALGPAGEINPGTQPSTLSARYPDAAVLGSVWCLPEGGAGLRLAPGATLLLVQDGFNHQPLSALDHSGANYETFVARPEDADLDSPTVPNLERLLFTGGYDWLVTVFGPSMVIFAMPPEEALPTALVGGAEAAVVPADWVIDAVNAVMDGDSLAYRRLPPGLDAGAAWVSGTYTGESLRRRAGPDGRLLDSDDSGADFEVLTTPEPGR